jgi:hypothetical protein
MPTKQETLAQGVLWRLEIVFVGRMSLIKKINLLMKIQCM